MPTDNAAFVGSIPENYDRYLGPVMFDPYAADLIARLDVPDNATVQPLDYTTAILTVWAIVWGLVAIWIAIRAAVRRAHRPGTVPRR